MKIEIGTRVILHFTLKLAVDGRRVESTRDGDPMALVIGEGVMVPGLENRLLGLEPGDTRHFEVPYVEAYGPAEVDRERVQNIPRSEFPPEIELELGQVIGFTVPNGNELPGTVLGFTDEIVSVDFTHPLAGHDLIFDVEIVAVELPK